ncbi:MAG TPA: pitrilysin family protein [Kofleriaceae bacterium]|nr:pitrilysin family protein [Kofleriaceae bacterium]
MSAKPFLVAAALALTVSTAHADDPKLDFEKYKLPNGLEVILAPDNHVPLVAVNVWYHVGSGNEVPGKSGFAHLFEHMMFQGSKNTGEDQHFAILRKIGSNEINGTTNTDRTNYFEVVPSHFLETALWLESDRMGHLLEMLDRKALDNQIDVVRNERRQNYDNVPYRKALFALYAAIYPEGHPYRYLTIGKHEDLTSASVDDVKNFFKTWYVPANATIAIVGDFDKEATKKLVEKWFGAFPTSQKPQTVTVPAPTVKAQTVSVDDTFAKQRQVTYAWSTPANFAPGDAELDIIANALGAEGRGRLYKTLVFDKQLATRVDVGQDSQQFSSIFNVTVTLRTEADLEQVTKIVTDEIARVTKENLSDKEIARMVTNAEAAAIYRLESLNNRANVLQSYNHFLGDPGKLSWDLDRYRKATPDGIRAIAAKYLVPSSMVTVMTKPAGGAK